MSTVPIYCVDAFTKSRFAGNQAAVFLSNKIHDDYLYLKIAAEFNLSETAYPIPLDNNNFQTSQNFSLRWFTPLTEVGLCGHATLATAHVIFNELGNFNNTISFQIKSGDTLKVTKGATAESYIMDFPVFDIYTVLHDDLPNEDIMDMFPHIEGPTNILSLIKQVTEDLTIKNVGYAKEAKKLIVELASTTTKKQLLELKANSTGLIEQDPDGTFVRGLIITIAPNNPEEQGFSECNKVACSTPGGTFRSNVYISRYFAPWVGIAEDPATGSSQCALAPYFAARLDKKHFYAFQAYPGRGAEFEVEIAGERLLLTGFAKTVITGSIQY
uniref:Phenazine biosynthesis-like domain-containing protein 1 n=1 Tax=Rhabditophanes sp. KR3021 TaxID=114890 RepID=A0AC35TKB4_9BILA